MKITKKKILITGGASGIGFGFAEQFIKDGNTVIICGRRIDALQQAQQKLPGLIIRRCDVSSEAERKQLFNWISSEHPDLNILVNNAGIQQWMNISDPDFFIRAKEEIAINIEAPLHLTALALSLKKLDTVMNVTSGLAFTPLTKTPVYSATKAFFHSFTLSLRHLLKERGVDVIEIIPPALNTDLGGKGLHDQAPPVSDFISSVFVQIDEGKKSLTFGFSEMMEKAGPAELAQAFGRMNP